MRHAIVGATIVALVTAPAAAQVPAANDVDRSRSWFPRSSGISNPRISTIAVHPSNSDIALAGTADGAVYRTDDGGETWSETLRIFVSTRERSGRGTRRSEGEDEFDGNGNGDTGTTEAEIEEQLEELFEDEKERIFDELVDELGEDAAEQAAEEQALEEVERRRAELESELRAQEAEVEVTETNAAIRELRFHPSIPGVVFAATSDGVWRFDDETLQWQQVLSGLGELDSDVTSVVAALSSPPPVASRTAWVLAGTRGGLRISEDAGDTWTAAAGTVGSAEVRQLAVHPLQRWRLAAATDRGVFTSNDGGVTWTLTFRSMGASGDVLSVAFERTPDDMLYVGTSNGLYAIDNQGSTQRLAGKQLPLPVVRRIQTLTEGHLVVATPRGAWVSDDFGRTFEELSRGLPTPNVFQVSGRATAVSNLWAATDLGVYRWLPGRPPTVEPLGQVPFGTYIEAAHSYALDDMQRLRKYARQVRMRRYFPRMRIYAGTGDFFRISELDTPYIGPGGTTIARRRRIDGYDLNGDSFFYVQLTWSLDELIHSGQTSQMRALTRRALIRRHERTARVVRLTRELTQVQRDPLTADASDREQLLNATMARLRKQELEAYLDAATGGVLTARDVNRKESEQ